MLSRTPAGEEEIIPEYQSKHVAMSVANLDAQRKFYGSAFNLTREQAYLELPETNTRMVILCSTDGLEIELVERLGSAPKNEKGLDQATSRQGYFAWAVVVANLEKAFERVVKAGAVAVTQPAEASRPGVHPCFHVSCRISRKLRPACFAQLL